ncbi:MAG: PIN domain-containing protein [Thermoleophilaceae bacterium]|nr:PIN domain-containing protein [Thermoleophilaceae bacterium]
MSAELLLDNSAWARLGDASVPQHRADEIADALEERRVATCLPFLLEAGCSARSASEHSELIEELLALPLLQIDEEVECRALDVQRQLALSGHHRLPPVDLILAAIADKNGRGVLHYDSDYDVLSSKTDLRFRSVWLAPRGTLWASLRRRS